jgi:hypothetical protein
VFSFCSLITSPKLIKNPQLERGDEISDIGQGRRAGRWRRRGGVTNRNFLDNFIVTVCGPGFVPTRGGMFAHNIFLWGPSLAYVVPGS